MEYKPEATVYEWEPGNGTRYEILYGYPTNGQRMLVFGWLNAPAGGRVMMLNPATFMHYTYVAEKLGWYLSGQGVCLRADIAALMEFLEERGHEVSKPTVFRGEED